MTASDAPEPTSFHTDGRVRNPVPIKLQGMTSKRNGNFAVMHIDLTGTKPSDRNAAAKRTSEETEARARRANQVGWQPVRRSKSAWHNDELHVQKTRNSDAATPPSKSAAPASTPAAAVVTSTSQWLQTRVPAPCETKAEQARLLTLLRTLHPILVVDQLCKALAYFGGIPSAPPPTDRAFPSSATTNGPGSLLVSWLAEIFPPVDDPAAMGQGLNLPPLSSVAGQTEATAASVPVRRARGRPKGSKSSKVRKDKGLKKSRAPPSADDPSGPQDANQPPSLDGPSSTSTRDKPEQVNPDASTLGAKKRGRAKGSKNKPKEKPHVSRGPPLGAIEASGAQLESSTSPTSCPSSMAQGAPAKPEDGQRVPAPAHSLSASAPRNEISVPAPAADADRGSRPSIYKRLFPGQGQQVERDGQQRSSLGPKAAPCPMSTKRPAQHDSSVLSDGTLSQGYSAAQPASAAPQDRLSKRRMFCKDMSQQTSLGAESQTLSSDATASPALSHGFTSASPQVSASRSFESHTNNSRSTNAITGAGLGLHQQQQHHSLQQQPQRFYAQQLQHPSPGVKAADGHSHGVMQTPGPSGPRSQMAGAYGAQQHAKVSPQMVYTQQQQLQSPMSSPMGPHGHHSASLGSSITGGHHQYSQGAGREHSGGNGAAGLPQQRGASRVRGPHVRAHGFHSNQHQQAITQPNPTGPFQSFSEQSYLNMDYGLTERDVQDAAAVTALGSPSQLEPTQAPPKSRDQHVFQNVGKR